MFTEKEKLFLNKMNNKEKLSKDRLTAYINKLMVIETEINKKFLDEVKEKIASMNRKGYYDNIYSKLPFNVLTFSEEDRIETIVKKIL